MYQNNVGKGSRRKFSKQLFCYNLFFLNFNTDNKKHTCKYFLLYILCK